MYIFNPEHDLCLANGDIHFVPPQSALDFGRDCASLTRFMHGLDMEADYDGPEPLKITPWGWNSVLRERLLKEGYARELMPTDEQLNAIAGLSDRRVALKALQYLNNRIANNNPFDTEAVPYEKLEMFTGAGYRIAAQSLTEVEEYLQRWGNVVLKAPLSGSGKGIRFVAGALSHSDAGWCRNLINRHGCVVVEKRFKPLLEFAMLFKCSNFGDTGSPNMSECKVKFIGYSLFYTENGMYKGNILASDEWIENEIVKYIPQTSLSLAKAFLSEFFENNIAGRYEGYIGVDQFVYLPFEDKGEIGYNPVVEINLRMTMGLLAHNIYNMHTNGDLKDGSHYFEIVREPKDGRMKYSYKIEPV